MFCPNLKRRRVPLSENAQGQHRWTPETETIFLSRNKERNIYKQVLSLPRYLLRGYVQKGVGLTEGRESFREEHTGKWGGGRKRERRELSLHRFMRLVSLFVMLWKRRVKMYDSLKCILLIELKNIIRNKSLIRTVQCLLGQVIRFFEVLFGSSNAFHLLFE